MLGKKVGIITYHNGKNHGAVLQAYALFKKLEKMGIDSEIINFEPDIERKLGFKQRAFIVLSSIIPKNKGFDRFLKEKIKMSPKYKKSFDLKNLNSKYDYFITGSDQVWNPNAIDKQGAYFLDFVSDINKKIPYAPSFGISEVPKDKVEQIRGYLDKFSKISVREETGKKIINDVFKKDCEVVLDPTLLLDKEEYEQICTQKKLLEPYIFVYFNSSEKLNKTAQELSKKTGYKVVSVHMTKLNQKSDFIKDYGADPQKFLSYIKNAELVLADSFHGTALSIVFEKPFLTFVNDSSGKFQTDSRKIDLLTRLGLSDRIVDNESEIDFDPFFIDYSKSRELLNIERQKSEQFLKNALTTD